MNLKLQIWYGLLAFVLFAILIVVLGYFRVTSCAYGYNVSSNATIEADYSNYTQWFFKNEHGILFNPNISSSPAIYREVLINQTCFGGNSESSVLPALKFYVVGMCIMAGIVGFNIYDCISEEKKNGRTKPKADSGPARSGASEGVIDTTATKAKDAKAEEGGKGEAKGDGNLS